MTTESTGVRLGDLLTGAGLLKPADLREAMLIAKQQGLPVGRVLIMSAYLTEHQLQAAVRAQSMLKDGLIDQETVLKALTLVGAEDLSLDDALKTLHWFQQEDVVTNKLGELLLEAEIVTKEQLQSALGQCESIGLPLGRVLVVTSIITEPMLAAALNAQVLVRDKKISREQAVTGLKSSKERQIPIEHALAEHGVTHLPTNDSIRLGELLLEAKLIDEPNLMGAVELGLINEKLIGEVLREQNLVPEETVFAALDLQKMVAEGAVKKADAPAAIALVHSKKISLSAALEELNPPPPAPQPEPEASPTQPTEEAAQLPYALPTNPAESLPLYQFLQLSGLITPKDIETAVRIGSKDSIIMGRMLVLSGILDQSIVSIAQKSSELIARGILNTEQGLMAIKTCKGSGISLDEAFTQFNWDKQSLKLVENVGLPLNEPGESYAPSAVPMLPTISAVKAVGARGMTQTLQIETIEVVEQPDGSASIFSSSDTEHGSAWEAAEHAAVRAAAPATTGGAEWGQQYAQPGVANLAAVAQEVAPSQPAANLPTSDADLWGVEPAERTDEANSAVKPLAKTLSSLWGTGEHSQPQTQAEPAPAPAQTPPAPPAQAATSSGQNWTAAGPQTAAWAPQSETAAPQLPLPAADLPVPTATPAPSQEGQSSENPWAPPIESPETRPAPPPQETPATPWPAPATASDGNLFGGAASGWAAANPESSGTGAAWVQQQAEPAKTSPPGWSNSWGDQPTAPDTAPSSQAAQWGEPAAPAPAAPTQLPVQEISPELQTTWTAAPAVPNSTPQPAANPDWPDASGRAASQWSEPAAQQPATAQWADQPVAQPAANPATSWANQQPAQWGDQPTAAPQANPATSGSNWLAGQPQPAANWGPPQGQSGWADQQQQPPARPQPSPTPVQQPVQPQSAATSGTGWQGQAAWGAPTADNQPAWGTPPDSANAQPQPQAMGVWGQTESQSGSHPSPFQTVPPAQMAQQIAQHQGWQQAAPDPTQSQPATTEEVIDELNEEDQQDKPKKRLMDFMPKLGS